MLFIYVSMCLCVCTCTYVRIGGLVLLKLGLQVTVAQCGHWDPNPIPLSKKRLHTGLLGQRLEYINLHKGGYNLSLNSKKNVH